MKIDLYEKKESLESMILGINKDPYRVNFHQYLSVIDASIETHALEESSEYALKLCIDGTCHELSSYPNDEDTAKLLGVDNSVFAGIEKQSGLLNAANTTRLGNCCGVGEDIYVDPNEEN